MATWIAGHRWLDMCNAPTWRERARQLRDAGVPLRLLSAESHGADNAYELWASFVHFLTLRYGWEKLDADNALKGIVSKTGISFQLDDKEKTLKLLNSENQFILIDENKKNIEIRDLNENVIRLDDQGISLQAAGKLVVRL